jgi:hypothetical protein
MASIGSIVNGPEGPAVVIGIIPGSSRLGPFTQTDAIALSLSGQGGLPPTNALTGAAQALQTQATVMVALLQLPQSSTSSQSSASAAAAYRASQALTTVIAG